MEGKHVVYLMRTNCSVTRFSFARLYMATARIPTPHGRAPARACAHEKIRDAHVARASCGRAAVYGILHTVRSWPRQTMTRQWMGRWMVNVLYSVFVHKPVTHTLWTYDLECNHVHTHAVAPNTPDKKRATDCVWLHGLERRTNGAKAGKCKSMLLRTRERSRPNGAR